MHMTYLERAAPLNLEQDTLNTETTMNYDDINDMMNYDDINDMMNTNMEAMQLKPVNVKTEQQAAEAIVPMLFGAIAQRADYVTHSVILSNNELLQQSSVLCST